MFEFSDKAKYMDYGGYRFMIIVDVKNLWVERGGRIICSVPCLQIDRGERVVVVGPNGSGKSTLLRILAGLERHSGGSCKIVVERRQRVYVGQSPYMFRGTVLVNAMYALRARGLSHPTAKKTAMRWLTRLGVSDRAASPSSQISGGERRRAALARAMAVEPELLLLDEPFADIDQEGLTRIDQALADLPHTTVVLSSPTSSPPSFSARVHCIAKTVNVREES